MSKLFRVIDQTDNSNVFGGDLPLDSLVLVYPMAPTDGRRFDTLDLHESVTAQTLTPMRGRSVYTVIRVQ